jgi:hypothetical protein
MGKAQLKTSAGEASKDTFHDDLKAFRARYPMCYVEAWTPDDFDRDDDGGERENVDWGTRLWKRVAARLDFEFDAEVGTHWGRVDALVSRLRAKPQC